MRRADRPAVTICIPIEARAILRRVSGERGRTQGQLVAQLLFEWQTKQDERERIRQKLLNAGCEHADLVQGDDAAVETIRA